MRRKVAVVAYWVHLATTCVCVCANASEVAVVTYRCVSRRCLPLCVCVNASEVAVVAYRVRLPALCLCVHVWMCEWV